MFSYRLREHVENLTEKYLPKYSEFLNVTNSTGVLLALFGVGLLRLQNLNLSKDVDKTKIELKKLDVNAFIDDTVISI